ncbi:hypothetical protein [Burkholderia ambifaria]|uniref:hypothetical protein n=1 Tax=Burkholderia ambifaria TaxID=152480 RepID=UPI002FDF2D75
MTVAVACPRARAGIAAMQPAVGAGPAAIGRSSPWLRRLTAIKPLRRLSPAAYGRPGVDNIARRVRQRGLYLSVLLRAPFEPFEPSAFHPTNFT